jgi:hypothetical protein
MKSQSAATEYSAEHGVMEQAVRQGASEPAGIGILIHGSIRRKSISTILFPAPRIY